MLSTALDPFDGSNLLMYVQAGLQGLDQLAPELAASTAGAFPDPGVSLAPGQSHGSEQPSDGQNEVLIMSPIGHILQCPWPVHFLSSPHFQAPLHLGY